MQRLTVSDQQGAESNADALEVGAGEVNETPEKKPRPYGKRNPYALIDERQKRLYKRQLSGLTTRQLVLEHADREGIAEATAWRDWEAVRQWNDEDWLKDRETIVSRLQGMRMKAIELALRKGQISTAQLLMRDLGAVAGEISVESAAAAAPTLQITVEDKRQAG
jgi:hypothetical protein